MFEVGSRYNFSTWAPAILGRSFKDALVSAIFDYETALNYRSVDYTHRMVKPLLPASSANNPNKLTYVLFKFKDGSTHVLANEWIDSSTVLKTTMLNAIIDLYDVDEVRIAGVQRALSLLGVNFNIRNN